MDAYNESIKEKLEEVNARVLTCPWCKSQDYTIKTKPPLYWYRRCKCNSCGKHFVRYDYNDKEGTKKALTPTLTQADIPVRSPYGWDMYEFYAVASSGNLHYAYAMDLHFDDDGIMIGFNTECGRDVGTDDDPMWPRKWKLYLRDAEDKEYKSVCLKCRKVR